MPKQGTSWPARGPQVLLQHLLELGEADPAPRQLLAIAVLAQKRLAAEDARRLLDRLVERQVLEGVQRVMVDEDGDRSLCRQEVAGVIDDLLKMTQLAIRFGPGHFLRL